MFWDEFGMFLDQNWTNNPPPHKKKLKDNLTRCVADGTPRAW